MKTISGILFFLLLSFSLNAQLQVISSAGDHAKSSNGSISWTLGEVVTATHSGSGVLLTQGFQQSNLEITTAVEEPQNLEIQIRAYPNPVQNRLTVEIQHREDVPLSLQLYDINGKLLKSRQIKTSRQNLNLEEYAQGQYILQVRSGQDLMKSFQIVKH